MVDDICEPAPTGKYQPCISIQLIISSDQDIGKPAPTGKYKHGES
jgi:hypothetical protein